MKVIDQLIVRLGTDYVHGYGPKPIPCAIDHEVEEVLDFLSIAKEEEYVAAIGEMKPIHGSVFSAYAERMASEAVRRKEALLLERGIKALNDRA